MVETCWNNSYNPCFPLPSSSSDLTVVLHKWTSPQILWNPVVPLRPLCTPIASRFQSWCNWALPWTSIVFGLVFDECSYSYAMWGPQELKALWGIYHDLQVRWDYNRLYRHLITQGAPRTISRGACGVWWGYGIPIELFGPFVEVCVDVMRPLIAEFPNMCVPWQPMEMSI